MKRCSIYRTDNQYKIVTNHIEEGGIYIGGRPIFIVDLNSDLQLFSAKIVESLLSSATMKKIKGDEYTSYNKEIIKELKESSYQKLQMNSVLCILSLQKMEISVIRTI